MGKYVYLILGLVVLLLEMPSGIQSGFSKVDETQPATEISIGDVEGEEFETFSDYTDIETQARISSILMYENNVKSIESIKNIVLGLLENNKRIMITYYPSLIIYNENYDDISLHVNNEQIKILEDFICNVNEKDRNGIFISGENGEVQFSLWNNKFDAGLIFCSKTQPKYSKSFVECFEISGGWYYYRSKYFF